MDKLYWVLSQSKDSKPNNLKAEGASNRIRLPVSDGAYILII